MGPATAAAAFPYNLTSPATPGLPQVRDGFAYELFGGQATHSARMLAFQINLAA